MSSMHLVRHGSGTPLIVLHGAEVDHREPEAVLEPLIPADRAATVERIYVDLPGMGRSAALDDMSSDSLVDALLEFVDEVADTGSFLIAGHSLGGYLARAVASARAGRCRGLALICPATDSEETAEHEVAHEEPGWADELAPEDVPGFAEYFVRRTPALARRYRDAVLPGISLADGEALGRMFEHTGLERRAPTVPVDAAVLVVAGRRDSTVGWRGAAAIAEESPTATFALVDGAGHALPHEKPELLGSLIADWLERAL